MFQCKMIHLSSAIEYRRKLKVNTSYALVQMCEMFMFTMCEGYTFVIILKNKHLLITLKRVAIGKYLCPGLCMYVLSYLQNKRIMYACMHLCIYAPMCYPTCHIHAQDFYMPTTSHIDVLCQVVCRGGLTYSLVLAD